MKTWSSNSEHPITPSFERACQGICKNFSTVHTWRQLKNQQQRRAQPEPSPIIMSNDTESPKTLIIDLTEQDPSNAGTSDPVSSHTANIVVTTQNSQYTGYYSPKSLVVTLKLKKAYSPTAGSIQMNQTKDNPTTVGSNAVTNQENARGHHSPEEIRKPLLRVDGPTPATVGPAPQNLSHKYSIPPSYISGQAVRQTALHPNAESLPGSNNSPETLPEVSHLPDDHTPRGFAEARAHYIRKPPPFVVNGTMQPNSTRNVYIVTIQGGRPKAPVTAELVCKPWTINKHSYWTLDVDDQRIIVKSFQSDGSIDGARYVYYPWVGVAQGFGPRPVAFTTLGNRYFGTLAHSRQAEQTDTRSDHMGSVKDRSGGGSNKTKSNPALGLIATNSAKKRKIRNFSRNRIPSETSNPLTSDFPSIEVQGSPITPSFHEILQSSPASSPSASQKLQSSLPPSQGWIDILQHQQSVFEQVSKRLRSSATPLLTPFTYIRPEPETLSSPTNASMGGLDGSSDAAFTDTDPSLVEGPRGRPRRKSKPTMKATSLKPEVANPKKRKLAGDDWMYATPGAKSARVTSSPSSPLSSLSSGTPLPTSSSTPRQSLIVEIAAPSLADGSVPSIIPPTSTHGHSLSRTASMPPPISPSSAQSHSPSTTTSSSDPTSSSLPVISPYKQRYTILRASCPSSIVGMVPLKLHSCMTLETFFATIINATGYVEQASTLSTIMVTFDFKQDSDSKKSIFVKRNVVDSFEVFLEMIDEAPCWDEERGRCEVAVDVVLPWG